MYAGLLTSFTYDAEIFPPMNDLLHHLKIKNFQNRKVGIIENGSWAPSAGKTMRAILDTMKDLEIVEPMVTIRSTMKDSDMEKLDELVKQMC